MLRFAILLVLVAAISYCDADCPHWHLPEAVCALLFDGEKEDCDAEKEDCIEGGAPNLRLKEGERNLYPPQKDNVESVLVQKGCSFRGYDLDLDKLLYHDDKELTVLEGKVKAAEYIGNKKNFVVVTAPEHENKWVNIDKAVRKTIKSVSCSCGNQGQCPQVPFYLCAIAYEKVGCDHGEWNHPLEIPPTEELNLKDVTHFNYSSRIESVSVRKGCSFRGYPEVLGITGHEGLALIEAPKHEDLHFDLKEKHSLPKRIVAIECTCD